MFLYELANFIDRTVPDRSILNFRAGEGAVDDGEAIDQCQV